MADISMSRNHSYGLDDATARLKTMLDGFQQKKPDLVKDLSWSGNTATASGKFFKGTFSVTDTQVKVDLSLIGFAAKMAKGMVRDQITKQLDREFPG
ncbi:MAG: polyhydroxyalkanoic acid system family protein [Myxococcales bacterium]|nr:polyhydroxyalkanoic acid system family protein [Myxococcales bacterium]